jgi:hypothetical protein
MSSVAEAKIIIIKIIIIIIIMKTILNFLCTYN